jgi:hypothetical protein
MGLFSGSSSKSYSYDQESANEGDVSDGGAVLGGGARMGDLNKFAAATGGVQATGGLRLSGGSNITLTDNGAVKESLDFADDFGNHALTVGGSLAQSALDYGNQQTTSAMNNVASQAAANAGQQSAARQEIESLAKSFQTQGQSDDRKIYLILSLAGLLVVGGVSAAALFAKSRAGK